MRTDRAVTYSLEGDRVQNDWHTPVKTLPSFAVGKYNKSDKVIGTLN